MQLTGFGFFPSLFGLMNRKYAMQPVNQLQNSIQRLPLAYQINNGRWAQKKNR